MALLAPVEFAGTFMNPQTGESLPYAGTCVVAIDSQGRSARWTGGNCVETCGALAGDSVSVAGNMLANADVLPATLRAYEAAAGLDLPERLLAALEAGEAAGGDRRGRQSAALKLVTSEDFPDLDLRVDDHATPLPELRRLVGLWRTQWLPRPKRGCS